MVAFYPRGIAPGSEVTITAPGGVQRVIPQWATAPVVQGIGPVDISTGGGEDGTLALDRTPYANRVHRLWPTDYADVSNITITSQPALGRAYVNPDGQSVNFVPDIDINPDTTADVNIGLSVDYASKPNEAPTLTLSLVPAPGQYDAGDLSGDLENGNLKWSYGRNFYQLRKNAQNRVMVEKGATTRIIHCSASGLTTAAIAARDSVAESAVDDDYLEDHPDGYGTTEALALDVPNAKLLWVKLCRNKTVSPHLFLEADGTYAGLGFLFRENSPAEGLRYPKLVSRYGVGANPVVPDSIVAWTDGSIVLQDIDAGAIQGNFSAHNIILDHVKSAGHEVSFQSCDGITLNHSQIHDAAKSAPANGVSWDDSVDRVSGLFTSDMEGLLLDNTFIDHCGWAAGYSPDRDGAFPQSPSSLSHNYYGQYTTRDVTVIGGGSTRASSIGYFLRGGGYVRDLLLVANNLQFSNLSGNYNYRGWIGDYHSLWGTVSTSAGYKETDPGGRPGALSGGLWPRCPSAIIRDNILCHAADPNDSADIARVEDISDSVSHEAEQYVNDTKVFNWAGSVQAGPGNRNVGGLDPVALNQATLQNFAKTELADPNATLDDWLDHLGTQNEPATAINAAISNIRAAFNVFDPNRSVAQTVTFWANDEGEGRRWDMRNNWTTEDLPGSVLGDSADLAGHDVIFQRVTSEIVNLNTGGGSLDAYSGYLGISGALANGGDISAHKIGWIDLPEYADSEALRLAVSGAGRIKCLGDVTGPVSASVADQGQLVLATGGSTFTLVSGEALTISGGECGFDGASGAAALVLASGSTTTISAAAGVMPSIRAFAAGDRQVAPAVTTSVTCGGDLVLDTTSLASGSYDLIVADSVTATFDSVSGGSVSYAADRVTLTV